MNTQTVDTTQMDPIVFANTWNDLVTKGQQVGLSLQERNGGFQFSNATVVHEHFTSLLDAKIWLDGYRAARSATNAPAVTSRQAFDLGPAWA